MPKRKTAPPLSDFKRWRKRLRKEYEAALEAPCDAKTAIRPRDVPNNVMRLAAYRYYRQLAEADLMDELRAYIEERDGSQWRGHGDGEELWVLRLIGSRGQQKLEQSATDAARARKMRSRIGAEFKLAALNNVRPKALLGFLYEAGTIEQIVSDAKNNDVPYAWAEAYQ